MFSTKLVRLRREFKLWPWIYKKTESTIHHALRMVKVLHVAEKPSVAKEISKILSNGSSRVVSFLILLFQQLSFFNYKYNRGMASQNTIRFMSSRIT